MSVLLHCLNHWKIYWKKFKRFSDTEVAGGLYPSEKIGSCPLSVTVIFFFAGGNSSRDIPSSLWTKLCVGNLGGYKIAERKKIHSRKLHRTIVENYLCYIDLQRFLPVSGSKCTRLIGEAKVWNGRIWTYARMQKGSLFTGRKTQFCDFSHISHFFSHFQENCLFRTWSHSVKSATP